jgi:hypothetical protein
MAPSGLSRIDWRHSSGSWWGTPTIQGI